MPNEHTMDSSAVAERVVDTKDKVTKETKIQFDHANQTQVPEIRSDYLVNRLFATPENNLFNYVKFHLVAQALRSFGQNSPKIMDIGCGLKVAKRFLDTLVPENGYFGVDYEAAFNPDAVVDLFDQTSLKRAMQPDTDVVMLLDVLEHLTDDVVELEAIMGQIAKTVPSETLMVITLPQMYRLDRLKLPHLHYPEHKIRRTQKEWLTSLEKHFKIETVQGLGYLSVLPYLPMLSRRYTPDNRLGRLFSHLRGQTFEKSWLKPIDLFLSNSLGKLPVLKHWSNDFLVVARPK